MVRRVAALAERLEVPLRVITFAVRGRTMYPPEVGLHAEDSILAAWEAQAARDAGAVAHRRRRRRRRRACRWSAATAGIRRSTTPSGSDGEILALGTSPRGDIARVFLGSRGTKIMRHSPVPVLVLPG